MGRSSIRVLVVDDYEPWRRFLSSTLGTERELQIIGEASDGLEAVQKAQELQPDLILLDIGLPTLNGIEAARQIRKVCHASRILFISENRSGDIAEEALSTGAGGYLLKSDAAGELLPAVKAVLDGKRFTSASLPVHVIKRLPGPQTGAHLQRNKVAPLTQPANAEIAGHHGVGFYSDDRHFIDDVTRFIGLILKGGNAAIVLATEYHRESLLSELQAHGLDVGAAIKQGRYIALDAAETLSMFMVNGMPDPARFLELSGELIMTARQAANGADPRVSVFGEGVHLLWEQGKTEAAIQIEKLCNKLTQIHGVNILCGYSLGRVESAMNNDLFERICAEHSAMCSY